MSLYLGRNKVGVTYKDVNPNVIDNETLEELNDAVGYRVGDYSTRSIPQMIEKLKKSYFNTREYDIMSDYHTEPWTRPQGWPDLDSLNLQMEGDDFIYMTYDNTRGRAAIAWHIEKVTNGENIEVTMGHISNGSYIVDETITGTSSNYVRWLTNEDDDYPVVRITGDIYRCYSYSVTQDGATQHYRKQPVLERIAWVPHLQCFCTTQSSNAWGVFTLQREKVANGEGTALTSLYYAWAYCRDLEDLDISGLRTPNVTNMESVFRILLKIRELDLKHFTVNKVTSFAYLFNGNRNLKKLDLSGWETDALTSLANTFDTCYSLQEIKGLENFNTSKVTSLSSTFSNCRSIKSLDLTAWNTEKVTNLNSTFSNCHSLIELDLSNWNVNKVTSLSSTFTTCYSLKRINFNGWQTGNLTTIYSLFSSCYSLSELDLSWLNITSTCTDICYAFNNCYSIREINLQTWDVTGVVGTGNRSHSVFSGCWNVEKITGIKNWQFRHTNSSTSMFANCYNLKELDVSGWDISNSTNLSSCFANCYNLRKLNLSNWNPANCTTLASMFSGCFSLTEVGDISEWDTSKVTTMSAMFRYCYSLTKFPSINDWDLSNVTSLDSIFSECTTLEEIIWNNVNIPKCTNVYQLFRYNYNLKKIETKNWTLASNITYSASYYPIYGDCTQLRDIEGIIIPSTYTQLGFSNCENLSQESLLTILNALPQTTAGHTIHITTAIANLLTTEEKAIATNKNWTIAN